MIQSGPKCGLTCMGVKSKHVLFSHEGRVIITGTKIKLLEGMTILAVNIAEKVCLDYLLIVLPPQVPT